MIGRDLLGIEDLAREDIERILHTAVRMQEIGNREVKKVPTLRGRTIVNLFFEASTRTRVSFEFAAKALGATTSVIHAESSSIEKGESLVDTGYTLRATGADAIVIRHPAAGAPHLLARHLDIPVINAGDGMHEHPSQALLDAFTMLRHRRSLAGLRVAIVGDIYHSRVARSNAHLLSKLSAQVSLCGPAELAPDVAATLAPGVRLTRHMEDALRGADVVMMLRVQKERLAGRSIKVADYIAGYQLTPERLKLARRDALVMHPGPMLRGMELTSEVADGPQSVIREQVHNGVAMRMAILARSLGAVK